MKTDKQKIDAWDLLDILDEQSIIACKNEINSRICLLGFCNTIKDKMPLIAINSLKVLETYIKKQASKEDLKKETIKLWGYYEKENDKTKQDSIRAVISALSLWTEDYEVFDSIKYCMDYCSSVAKCEFDDDLYFILKENLKGSIQNEK